MDKPDPLTPRTDDKMKVSKNGACLDGNDKACGIPGKNDKAKSAASDSYGKNDASTNFAQDEEDELELEDNNGGDDDRIQPYPPSQPEVARNNGQSIRRTH